jgi:ABC-2 type transport system permease protein
MMKTGFKAASNIRLFWQGALLSYKALFRWFRPTTYLASKIIMPIAQMVFFTLIGTYGGAASPHFFVIGNAMQIAAISGIYGVTMSIGGDRWDGTLPYLFGSPSNRLVLFFGRSFLHIADGLLGVTLAFVWGRIIFGLIIQPAALPYLALTVLVTVFSTSGMGLLMGCIGLISRNVMFVNNTIYFLLLLFSGANIPLAKLPLWMQKVSALLPLHNGIKAARLIQKGVPAPGEIYPLILKEFRTGCVYLVLGYLLFTLFERRAKKKGSLETI